MNPRGFQKHYSTDEIFTADPRKITLMLYEGAIRFLKQAKDMAQANDVEARQANIDRASAILYELLQCLDFEKGGEIAEHLRDLYIFIIRRLVDAGTRNDPAPIAECIPILEVIHEGWELAMFKPAAELTTQKPSQVSYSFQI